MKNFISGTMRNTAETLIYSRFFHSPIVTGFCSLERVNVNPMIMSFKSKALKSCWYDNDCIKLPQTWLNRICEILKTIDEASVAPDDLFSCGVHQLKGNYKNYWSLKVNRNYRIIFTFIEGNAYDLDYIDYH